MAIIASAKNMAVTLAKIINLIFVYKSYKDFFKYFFKWFRRKSKLFQIAKMNSLLVDNLDYLFPMQGISFVEGFKYFRWLRNPWILVCIIARFVDFYLSFLNTLETYRSIKVKPSFFIDGNNDGDPQKIHEIAVKAISIIYEFSDIAYKLNRKFPRFFYQGMFSEIRNLFLTENKLEKFYRGFFLLLALDNIKFRMTFLWKNIKHFISTNRMPSQSQGTDPLSQEGKLQDMMPNISDPKESTVREEKMIIAHPLCLLPYAVGTVGAMTSLPKPVNWVRVFEYMKPMVPISFHNSFDIVSSYLPGGAPNSTVANKVASKS